MLIGCEDPTGVEHDVVVKIDHLMELGGVGLVAEALSSLLASDVGLKVPTPYLVELDDGFVDSVKIIDEAAGRDLQKCCRVTFGCELITGYWPALPPQEVLPEPLCARAGTVFAFDVTANNADRRPANPNCLTNGEEFIVLDHELAFFFGTLFYRPPWEEGGLEGWATGAPHLFYRGLKGQNGSIDGFFARLGAIPAPRFDSYVEALPAEWSNHQERAVQIVDFMRDLKSNRNSAQAEVRRILT